MLDACRVPGVLAAVSFPENLSLGSLAPVELATNSAHHSTFACRRSGECRPAACNGSTVTRESCYGGYCGRPGRDRASVCDGVGKRPDRERRREGRRQRLRQGMAITSRIDAQDATRCCAHSWLSKRCHRWTCRRGLRNTESNHCTRFYWWRCEEPRQRMAPGPRLPRLQCRRCRVNDNRAKAQEIRTSR